jgi:hypothetical protein
MSVAMTERWACGSTIEAGRLSQSMMRVMSKPSPERGGPGGCPSGLRSGELLHAPARGAANRTSKVWRLEMFMLAIVCRCRCRQSPVALAH